jgi:poly(rC)-binding protein 3/4
LTNNSNNVNVAASPPSATGGANPTGPSSTDAASSAAALASAIPLAQLLSKPGALNALTSLTALGGLTDLLGGLTNLGPPVQTTGVHRAKAFNARARPATNAASNDMNKLKSERSKFNPY